MYRNSRVVNVVTTAVSLSLWAGCDASGLGGAFGGLFGSKINVVIENETDYTAVLDLRRAASRNLFEDVVAESDPITNFGNNGAVDPNQSETFTLSCDEDLEVIVFRGAEFRHNNVPVGEFDDLRMFRRDVNFDCGATIHIRLSGRIFGFDGDVTVDRTDETRDAENTNVNENDNDSDNGSIFGGDADDEDDDDIAETLDQLFGG